MSPVLPTDPEVTTETRKRGEAGGRSAGRTEPMARGASVDPVASPEANEATANGAFASPEATEATANGVTDNGAGEAPTTPAPTTVDAYKPRGIRRKHDPLGISHAVLRILTALFALVAFAVIASDSATWQEFQDLDYTSYSIHFQNYFYFSYLLTANVIVFVYAVVTLILTIILLLKSSVTERIFVGMFVLDQILSYLLMSASTGAATGIRIEKGYFQFYGTPNSYFATAYAAITFSFLAFFTLALASLISGLRVARIFRNL